MDFFDWEEQIPTRRIAVSHLTEFLGAAARLEPHLTGFGAPHGCKRCSTSCTCEAFNLQIPDWIGMCVCVCDNAFFYDSTFISQQAEGQGFNTNRICKYAAILGFGQSACVRIWCRDIISLKDGKSWKIRAGRQKSKERKTLNHSESWERAGRWEAAGGGSWERAGRWEAAGGGVRKGSWQKPKKS